MSLKAGKKTVKLKSIDIMSVTAPQKRTAAFACIVIVEDMLNELITAGHVIMQLLSDHCKYTFDDPFTYFDTFTSCTQWSVRDGNNAFISVIYQYVISDNTIAFYLPSRLIVRESEADRNRCTTYGFLLFSAFLV